MRARAVSVDVVRSLRVCSMAFEFANKDCSRAAFEALCKRPECENKPAVMIDSRDAGGTLALLKNGMPSERLVVVNNHPGDCCMIANETGVKAICMNAEDFIVKEHKAIGKDKKKKYSAVWLDTQSRSVHNSTVASSLAVASYVMITLATRGANPDDVMKKVVKQVRDVGGKVLRYDRYCGRSGKNNMVEITAGAPEVASAAPVAPVASTAPAMESYIGQTVYMPRKLWNYERGYTDVAVKKDCFKFKVEKTHNKTTLAVRAIHKKKGRKFLRLENFTLTPREVMQYITPH